MTGLTTSSRFGKGKAFAALLGSAALTAALIPGVALATGSTDDDGGIYTNDPAQVTLTKVVQANAGQEAPLGDYTFHFASADSGAAAIADQTIIVRNPNNDAVASGTVRDFMPAATAFGHAGHFTYTVTETAGNNAGITYDHTVYTMDVWIANDGNSLTYNKIIVTHHSGTPGTPGDETHKIDPTPGTNGSTDITSESPDGSQFAWTNETSAVSNFTITKNIDGTFANKSKDFTVHVTLTLPSNVTTDAHYNASINGPSGSQPYNFVIPAGSNTVTVDVPMHNGTILTFDASTPLPEGTTYQVSEDATPNWVANGVATNAGSTTENDTGTQSEAFTSATHTLTKGTGQNAYVLTNTDNEGPGTGIVMNNLPFVVLGGAAIVGIAYYTVSRKRREN